MKIEDIFKRALEGKKWNITGTGEGPVQGVVELAQFDGCLTLHFPGRDALRLNPLQMPDLKFEMVELPKVAVPEPEKAVKIKKVEEVEEEPKPKVTKKK